MILVKPAISIRKTNTHTTNLESRDSTEKRLVEAAKDGHSTAFGALCERHTQQLLRAAHRITRSREDAEDAVQDALLRAFVHVRNFDGRSSFATWLTRIGINSALMLLRKRRGWHEVHSDDSTDPGGNRPLWDVPDSSPNPESSCLRREREETLRREIRGLRPSIREVIELGQLQERTMKQTAGMMGISLAAAKGRLFHARRVLRNSKALRTVCRAQSTRRASRFGAAA